MPRSVQVIYAAAMAAAILLPPAAEAQDMRLSTDCRLNRYSLPCLGYDMETARRMVQEQDARIERDAEAGRQRDAENFERQRRAREAPVPPHEFGPETTVIGPWTIFCARDRMTDEAHCSVLADLPPPSVAGAKLHVIPTLDGFALAASRSASFSRMLFRIDSQPPITMPTCTANNICAINVTRGTALDAALRSGTQITLSFDGAIAAMPLAGLAEAVSELERQAKRWGVKLGSDGPQAKPKAPASPTPAIQSPWRRSTHKDAITDSVQHLLWTPATNRPAPPDQPQQFVLACSPASRNLIVFFNLPLTENPSRRSAAWPAAHAITIRVDQRPALDLLAEPMRQGGARILPITPEELARLERSAAGLPPPSSSSLQELSAPSGANEFLSELIGGKQLIARIETASGRLDLRFDISGFEAARQHLAPCLK